MFGKTKQLPPMTLLKPDRPAGPVFVEFRGATMDYDDEGKLIDIVPRETVVINVSRITGFYTHKILVDDRKISVMESTLEIWKKIQEAIG